MGAAAVAAATAVVAGAAVGAAAAAGEARNFLCRGRRKKVCNHSCSPDRGLQKCCLRLFSDSRPSKVMAHKLTIFRGIFFTPYFSPFGAAQILLPAERAGQLEGPPTFCVGVGDKQFVISFCRPESGLQNSVLHFFRNAPTKSYGTKLQSLFIRSFLAHCFPPFSGAQIVLARCPAHFLGGTRVTNKFLGRMCGGKYRFFLAAHLN